MKRARTQILLDLLGNLEPLILLKIKSLNCVAADCTVGIHRVENKQFAELRDFNESVA